MGPVSVHYRGQTYLFALSEVPLLLGLVIAAPVVLVICRVLGEGFALGVIRRQSPMKLAFNLASAAMSCVVAIIVYRAILHPFIHPGSSRAAVLPIGWAAGAVALSAAFLYGHLAVTIVVRLNGHAQRRKYGFEFTTVALVLVSSIALALVVLDAAWWDTWAVLPLVTVGALIVFAYRGYLRLTNRFGALQQLYDFSRSVSGPYLETAGTAWAVLEQVQSVMRSNRAELIIVDEWPSVRHIALNGDVRSTVQRTIVDSSSVIAKAITNQQASLRVGTSGSHRRESDVDSLLGEFRGAMVVPLASGERTLGALVALDRDEGFAAFDDDDLRLFEALAAHASTTMERAQLVEELRLEAESKWHQATHDLLTGLPNRTLFLDRATAALAETGRAAVALLDLDRFKEVNDTLGHGTGDRLLCEVAETLVRASSGRATVARLGGDEFVLVVPDIIGPEEALGIVRDLLAAVSKPMNIDGITLAVTATAGISLAPEHGDNVATLLQRADIAMYHGKAKRSGIELYSPAHDQSMQRKLLLGGHLAEALASGQQLSVMYQPIAGLVSGEVVRCEALARWFHPVHGQVPADEFIQIAEQMGLIGQITDFVLNEACSQAAQWRRDGLDIGLAINLSGRDLSNRSLVRNITAHLGKNGLPASSLVSRDHRDRGHGRHRRGERRARPARRPRGAHRRRRLRHRVLLARLSAPPARQRAEAGPLLRRQRRRRPEQLDHRPLLDRHGALARPHRRRRGSRGRGHLRHPRRRGLRRRAGLLLLAAARSGGSARAGSPPTRASSSPGRSLPRGRCASSPGALEDAPSPEREEGSQLRGG